MRWYAYIGFFFAGAFIANSIPHLVQGISGQEFRTPFAETSSSVLNVLWGFLNLAIGYIILTALEGLSFSYSRRVAMAALGFLAMAVNLAIVFG